MNRTRKRPRGPAVLAGLIALLGASACGDTDERPLKWSYISATIIQPNCGTSRCHSAGSEAGGYRFDNLRESCDNLRDLWGASVLAYLRAEPGVIERMPPDAPLPEGDIALIERYFAENAMMGDDSCAP